MYKKPKFCKMKKILFSIFLGSHTLFSQNIPQMPKAPKSIAVSGTAEMKIIPDEIYFSITIREFMTGSNKYPIDKLEKQLVDAVLQAGIDRKNLMLDNVSSYNGYEKRNKSEEFLVAKTYEIKVSDQNKLNSILEKIEAKGISNTNITNYSHSKMPEFKKQLKIQALKNAKEKANYLLEAIGEQLGEALRITEDENAIPQPYYANTRMLGQSMYDNSGGGQPSEQVDFKTIKIQFSIQAEFAIK